jgi:hypothetical protein
LKEGPVSKRDDCKALVAAPRQRQQTLQTRMMRDHMQLVMNCITTDTWAMGIEWRCDSIFLV